MPKIAKIIPAVRLPSHLGVFDYVIPIELKKDAQIGSLVTIPFRKKDTFGIIVNISETNEGISNLEKITSLAFDTPLLLKHNLSTIQTISTWYKTSPSTLLKMMLPPLQKRKLKKQHVLQTTYNKTNNINTKPFFHLYKSNKEHSHMLQSTITQNTVIFVPEAHLIDEVRQLLSVEQQQEVVVWHSKLSTKQKFERWFQVRNNEKSIIIGTRGAVFLPFQKLNTIIIDYEHNINHKHWDQTPRFHVKDITQKLMAIYNAKLHLTTYSPSSKSYLSVHKGMFDTSRELVLHNPGENGLSVINMKHERAGKNFDIFAEKTVHALQQTKDDAFIFVNRKGFASSMHCKQCGKTEICSTCSLPYTYRQSSKRLHCHYCKKSSQAPHTCNTCGNQNFSFFGVGTEQVTEKISSILNNNEHHEIITIDSDLEKLHVNSTTSPRIIIGTRSAFRHIRWKKTSTVVYLDIDRQLAIPEFMAGENVWHTISNIQYRRKKKSTFFIQTFDSHHLIFRSLREPDRFYRTDLNARRGTGYPPYTYMTRYFFGHYDIRIARQTANRVYEELQKKLTTKQKNVTLSSPIEMHPRYFRKKFWFVFFAKYNAKTWQDDLAWLNQYIPHNWKVDPNPISFLSP